MDIESKFDRAHERYTRVQGSNCLSVFATLSGLVTFGIFLALEYGSDWASKTILAGVWPWLIGCSATAWGICAIILTWHLYQLKIAHDKKIAEVKLLQESYSQSHQTTLLLKDARTNNDNIEVTYNDDEKVKSIKVIRSAVLLEQTRIQQAARSLPAPGRQVAQQPQEQKQLGPVVLPKKQLVAPGPYDLIQVMRRFPLAEDHLFLGIDSDKRFLACNPRLELCHGAFNAVSGRGKTIMVRGIETQLLKTGYEVVHADIKFTLIDEFGNDYRPIARSLLAQGDMNIDSLALPHLLMREEHIVHLLEWLAGPELQRRLWLYNQGKHTYKVFFLFLEELLYLIGKYKHLGPIISPLLSVGRSLGIKIFCAAQNFQVQNLKINSGMRENFESAWFLGGDMNSGAALLDMSARELNFLLSENTIQLGKGVSIFRNNSVAYNAQLMRGGMASNEFVYWLLGKADDFLLPDEILPVIDAGPSTPSRLWVPSPSDVSKQNTGGDLPVDEDVREALEVWRNGAKGPRAMERVLGCTYYQAQKLCKELVDKGLVETDQSIG